MRPLMLLAAIGTLAITQGCATSPAIDYSAFLAARPTSLLVLPPLNESPDVKGTPGVWAHATRPLAEAGYYVLPVTLVDTMLRENGIQAPADAHQIPPAKLREVFGADAALYLIVKQYGTRFVVLSSETRVDVQGRLIDLRSGQALWNGQASASSAEQSSQVGGGLAGLLAAALIRQVVETATDHGYNIAAVADQRLLGVPQRNGVLAGPRSPLFGRDLPR